MNNTYWGRLLVSNMDTLEIQKEMWTTEALAIAGGLSMYQTLRSPSFS